MKHITQLIITAAMLLMTQTAGAQKNIAREFGAFAEAPGSVAILSSNVNLDRDMGKNATYLYNEFNVDKDDPQWKQLKKAFLPRIPYSLMEQAIGLFRTMMRKGKGRQPAEALVHFYWDKQEQRYFIRVPKQIVSGVSVDALLDDEELMTSDRYIHYADLHSHNRMPAVFSKTDDHDERATRVYMVVGRLDRYFPEITVRISNGGRFLEIAPEQVLEMPPVGHFPPEWLTQICTDAEGAFGVAA